MTSELDPVAERPYTRAVSRLDRLRERSTEDEWLDDLDCTGPTLEQAMAELARVNRFLGGHLALTKAMDRAVRHLPSERRPIRIVDVGCGSGDGLEVLAAWGRRRGLPLDLIGVDANRSIVALAEARIRRLEARAKHRGNPSRVSLRAVQGDAFGDTMPELQPDIVLASLFCHHFSLTHLRNWLTRALSHVPVVVVSDLHRHPIAHVGFRALARAARVTAMTRHDGAVSVRRGFTRRELATLASELPVREAAIRWRAAFRFEVILVSSVVA